MPLGNPYAYFIIEKRVMIPVSSRQFHYLFKIGLEELFSLVYEPQKMRLRTPLAQEKWILALISIKNGFPCPLFGTTRVVFFVPL